MIRKRRIFLKSKTLRLERSRALRAKRIRQRKMIVSSRGEIYFAFNRDV